MARLKVYRGTQENLDDKPVEDGALYVTTDTKKLYLDNGSDRIPVADSVTDVKVNDESVVANNVASITLDKAAVGLSNVDNTSDLDKPISTATQQALNDKLSQDNILEGDNITIQKDGINNITISTPGYFAGNGLEEAWNTFSIKVCETNWNADVGKSHAGFIEMAHTVDENGLSGHAIPFDTNIFEGTGYSSNVFSIKDGAITAEKIADGVIPDTSGFMTASAANAAFAAKEHNHDDRYYTETEVDSKLSSKANTTHSHTSTDVTDFNDAVEALIPAAPTELPNPEALTISLNGTSQGAYDGSAAKSINITAASVGAAATSHEHSATSITSGTLSTDRLPSIPDAKIAGVSASKISGVISSANLPSYVDDVLEYDSQSDFPPTGESGKIYIAKNTNTTYRWGGSDYVAIGSSLALGTTSSTAFRGDYGNTAYQHALAKGSAYSSGLYKITTNAEGHVTAATAVQKSDITALGIPAQDTNTTYNNATTSTDGLMSSADKTKLDGIATGANKYVLPAATSSVLGGVKVGSNITNSSGTISLTKANVTAALGYTPPTTDTNTWIALKGATTSAAGTAGYAPAPAAGAANRYLRSDGTWSVPPDTNTTYTLSSFGITATAAELNKLDGCTATVTELNYVDGVTSNIQTQLNGKAASSHTHSYLPLSGGTLTGTLTSRAITPSANNTYNLGTSSMKFANVYATTFVGALSGNATTATTATKANQLTTARTITASLSSSTAGSFNGTANITVGTTGTLPVSKGGTGATTAAAARTNLAAAASDIILVQSAQPTSSTCKLWIKI